LLGSLQPAEGTIDLDDRPLKKYSKKALAKWMAYVPQFPTSAFSFSVQELVLMGRYAHAGTMGLAGDKDIAIAREAMKMTETLNFASRRLEELSGGEAQRVMIARALAQQPAVMMLDEPTSHLDIRNQLKIYRMMVRLAHDWGMAVVCVSHDVSLAGRFADELMLMRDGCVIAAGTGKNVLSKQNLQQTYDVEIELISTSFDSSPIIWAN
jgi:iron complex transport system ATP-binding protein